MLQRTFRWEDIWKRERKIERKRDREKESQMSEKEELKRSRN